MLLPIQYAAGMIAKLPVNWPQVVKAPIKDLSNFWAKAFGSVASLDCLLQSANSSSPLTHVDRSGLKALLNLLLPVVVYLLVLACQMAWWWISPRLQPAVASLILKLYKCCESSDGVASIEDPSAQQPDRPSAASATAGGSRISMYLSRIKTWSIRAQFRASRPRGWCHVSSFQACMQQSWVVTLLVSIFFFYPSIVRIAFTMFTCITVCEQQYWVMDMDLICPAHLLQQNPLHLPAHAKWAAGVGIPAVLIVIAVPLAVAALLWGAAEAGRLHTAKFKGYFGFMYSDYNISHVGRQQQPGTRIPGARGRCLLILKWLKGHLVLAWDAVIHIQTVLLVCVSVVGMLAHEYYQTLALAAVFGSYLICIAWLRPFRMRKVQQLQSLSSAVLLLTCLLVLLFIPPDFMDDRQHAFYQGAQPVAGVLLLVVNILFIAFSVVLLLRCVWRMFGCTSGKRDSQQQWKSTGQLRLQRARRLRNARWRWRHQGKDRAVCAPAENDVWLKQFFSYGHHGHQPPPMRQQQQQIASFRHTTGHHSPVAGVSGGEGSV
jgi:hypothetical protein